MGSGRAFKIEEQHVQRIYGGQATWCSRGTKEDHCGCRRESQGGYRSFRGKRTPWDPKWSKGQIVQALKISQKSWVFTWHHYGVFCRWCNTVTFMSWNFPFGYNVENRLEFCFTLESDHHYEPNQVNWPIRYSHLWRSGTNLGMK